MYLNPIDFIYINTAIMDLVVHELVWKCSYLGLVTDKGVLFSEKFEVQDHLLGKVLVSDMKRSRNDLGKSYSGFPGGFGNYGQ